MWQQFSAIVWAQFRSIRNRLPRTTFGALLMGVLMVLWYALFATIGGFAGFAFSALSRTEIGHVLPIVLFAAFLFWQWLPLLTMSGGWSLQLNKLQSYPVANRTFFWIETLLRLSTAPELVLIVLGIAVGLILNPGLHSLAPLLLLLYIPFNLFLTLAIRETLLVSFKRSRFRELFAVLFIGVAVLPQIVLRTSAGEALRPYFAAGIRNRWTPWYAFSQLVVGPVASWPLLVALAWTAAVWWCARFQFGRALRSEETPRVSEAGSPARPRRRGPADFIASISTLFRDPAAALIEKEIRALVRMPRFRVIFGMACIFSILVFFPIGFGKGGTNWIRDNFLPVVNLYGLLVLGDTLIWNVFGFDRSAAQFSFLSAPGLRTTFHAKNITAALFIAFQNMIVLTAAMLLRFPVSSFNVECAFLASAVVSVYFFAIGNISSVTVPRAVDPSQTLRKQAGAKLQLWLLGSAAAMTCLVGFAFLARWALDSNWALVGVFAIEFAIGVVVYRIAMDSAVARGLRDRERILDDLSKSAAPISM